MNRYLQEQFIYQKLNMIMEYQKIKNQESKYFKTVKEMCYFYGISRKTFYKYLKRYKNSHQNSESLLPQSRRPKTNRNMPSKELERLIVKLRKKLGYSALLISMILRKRGISRISEFGVYQVFKRYRISSRYEKKYKKNIPKRYEKQQPWELIHIDDKRVANVKGEDPKQKRYSFKAVDDCTRFKFTKEYPDKTAQSACDFLQYVVQEIKKLDPEAQISAVLTDNGKAYTCKTQKGRKNHPFEKTCKQLGIKHKRTQIRRPQTNGKVEYAHYLYDKEFYRKTKFLSFADREKKLKSFTNQLNYLIPSMALKGLTPYEKWLSTTTKIDLSVEQHYAIKYIQQNYRKEVINEKLAS